MRSLDLWGALRRRWYVLVAGTLATAGLAAAAYAQVGATYELRASAVLLPPSVSVVSPEQRELVNPFLRLDGIDPALSVLVTRMMAEDFSDRMLEGAPSSRYTVAEDPVSRAPIVVATASSSEPDEASKVLDRVTDELPTVLDDLQDEAGITSSARITLLPLVRDEEPQRVLGGLLRIEILVLGAGLVGTLLLAGLWDAIARSRASSATSSTTSSTRSSARSSARSFARSSGRAPGPSAPAGPAPPAPAVEPAEKSAKKSAKKSASPSTPRKTASPTKGRQSTRKPPPGQAARPTRPRVK